MGLSTVKRENVSAVRLGSRMDGETEAAACLFILIRSLKLSSDMRIASAAASVVHCVFYCAGIEGSPDLF